MCKLQIVRFKKNPLMLLLFFLFVSGFALCQNKFILTPGISIKSSLDFVDPANYYSTEKKILGTQQFSQPYSLGFCSRVVPHPNFGYGLSVGYMFKNDTRFLQLSYLRDATNFRAKSYFRAYNSKTYSGWGVDYYGMRLHRITLNYSMKFSQKHPLDQTWFSFGIGTFINISNWTGIFPNSWNLPLSPNGDVLLRTYLRPFAEKRINAFIKIGLEHDLHIKEKYIFSMNAYYIQGFGIISRVEFVHEYMLNGSFVYDGTGLMSRGSGFYLGISRRIQLYPFRKKLKKSRSE